MQSGLSSPGSGVSCRSAWSMAAFKLRSNVQVQVRPSQGCVCEALLRDTSWRRIYSNVQVRGLRLLWGACCSHGGCNGCRNQRVRDGTACPLRPPPRLCWCDACKDSLLCLAGSSDYQRSNLCFYFAPLQAFSNTTLAMPAQQQDIAKAAAVCCMLPHVASTCKQGPGGRCLSPRCDQHRPLPSRIRTCRRPAITLQGGCHSTNSYLQPTRCGGARHDV